MALYYPCPHCGANLDPGERCDCEDRANYWVAKEKVPDVRLTHQGTEVSASIKNRYFTQIYYT